MSNNDFITKIENEFIKKTKGILHIGAHYGQEAERYQYNSVKVIWIEAIPHVHEKLEKHISQFHNQTAVCALLGDQDNFLVEFHLASNDYASSSIYKFGKQLGFRSLSMNSKMTLPMIRLDSLYTLQAIREYEHWVLDVQGSELLVLRGAGDLLKNCKSMLVEVSTRQVYEGGVSWDDLQKYLSEFGLIPLWQPEEHSHENIIFFRPQS
jgi:FkbM family methyltransferase